MLLIENSQREKSTETFCKRAPEKPQNLYISLIENCSLVDNKTNPLTSNLNFINILKSYIFLKLKLIKKAGGPTAVLLAPVVTLHLVIQTVPRRLFVRDHVEIKLKICLEGILIELPHLYTVQDLPIQRVEPSKSH